MTGTIEFREGTAADRDAILALRELVFAHEDREKQERNFWNWEFIDGYAGAGRFFVAEADDRIVGHFAFVPQRFRAAEEVDAALAVDVMTHPAFQRKGVFSSLASFAAARVKDHFQMVIAFQIRDQVLAGMEAGGWTPVLEVPILLKPLSWRGIAHDLGLPVRPRSAQDPATRDSSIRPLDDSDFEKVEPLMKTGSLRQPRTPRFLSWRYRDSPGRHYAMLGLFQGDQLRAFVIHRDSTLRGMRSLAIVDAGVDPADEAPLRHLLRHVCRGAAGRGLSLAAALLTSDHRARRALKRSGFLRGPHRFRLLLQVFDDRLRWAHDGSWSLSWGDTDHL